MGGRAQESSGGFGGDEHAVGSCLVQEVGVFASTGGDGDGCAGCQAAGGEGGQDRGVVAVGSIATMEVGWMSAASRTWAAARPLVP